MIRAIFSLFFTAFLTVVALAFTVFTARVPSVTCTRASGSVSCTERETIGPYVAWSRTVEHIATARPVAGSSDVDGVVAETESGDQIPLTSTFLDANQQLLIANRIHAFIFVEQNQTAFTLTLPLSLLGLGVGGAFTLLGAASSLVSLVRVVRRVLG